MLNLTRASRDLHISERSADNYLRLLEAVFLVRRLPAWGTTLNSRAGSRPKIHVVDSGVAARLLRLTSDKLARRDPTALTELGHLLETFVVGELTKQASWLDGVAGIGHWRTRDDDEVDLVVERDDGGVVAFEIKASQRVELRGLAPLRKLHDALGSACHRRCRPTPRGTVLHGRGASPRPFGRQAVELVIRGPQTTEEGHPVHERSRGGRIETGTACRTKKSEPRSVPCGRGLGEFCAGIPGMPPTQPGFPAIEAVLSTARLQPYLDACSGNTLAALELYEWNIAVSAAFWEIIAVTEVAMRNAMHLRLSDAYGSGWYDNESILDDRSLKSVREAKRRAARGLTGGPTSGKIISEMNFGVWVALLDRGGQSTALGNRHQPCSGAPRTQARRHVGRSGGKGIQTGPGWVCATIDRR